MNIICGITSKNHIAKLRALVKSARKYEPYTRFVALLVDRCYTDLDPALEEYELMTIEELDNIPDRDEMIIKYNILELNTAVKPFFIDHIFNKYNADKVVYFDVDILLFSDLSEIWKMLDKASMVITPHITKPYTDDKHPNEIDINRSGVYNLGFLGISRGDQSFAFLDWWKERLAKYCFVDLNKGMFVDQIWVNFAPILFEDVMILKDPAFNIAYWNLHERATRLVFRGETLFIDDEPAVFFHFSGYNPNTENVVSIHQDRYDINDLPNLKGLFDHYRKELLENGLDETAKWSYAFDQFDNGVPIPKIARQIYFEWRRGEPDRYQDLFSTQPGSFYDNLNSTEDETKTPFTRLQLYIYNHRSDLQNSFPNIFEEDRSSFIFWLLKYGKEEYSLPPEFLPPVDQLSKFGSVIAPNINARATDRFEQVKKFALKKINRLIPSIAPIEVHQKLPFGVNVLGYFKGSFGVAEAAKSSVSALRTTDIPFVVNDLFVGNNQVIDRPNLEIVSENPYRLNLLHVNVDQTPELIKSMGEKYFEDHFNIGLWFWELENFPFEWRQHFPLYQEVWTVSSFCQRSIGMVSPIPVVKMTMPVEVSKPDPKFNKSYFGIRDDVFTFGFVFDHLSYQERKNPMAVVDAFQLAFEDRKDVQLVIKSINAASAPQQAAMLAKRAVGSNIKIMDGLIPKPEMSALMSNFDCYVSLHRSEGFGIELARSMARGKPVIATGYSGNLEFMDHNNSYLVKYEEAEISEDLGPYKKGQVWAEPDIEHAASYMVEVVENGENVNKITSRAKKDIESRFSAKVAGEKMRARLLELSG